ncbi:MFS transporter [Chitinophaga barathri]|uniref:MFS transporter n=1 Tax=Chitinophaga barathri TaxID=1647451 RepID=A0A3N4M4M8_9BACT|nr:MFS transporter [Chitinophaga barathri]RPD38084.1 MFS transporter [Chitinophaga barathri]
MKKNNRSGRLALVTILTAPLLYVIDIFIINMAIPAIQKGLSATNGDIQLVIAGYLLGSAAFLVTGGRAGDYLGKKKTFLWGMFFFTFTSCLCGISQTATQLNIIRFFQGISTSIMVPQSIAYINVLYMDQKKRAIAIGWYGVTLSIAAIIGQILGGYLADTTLWGIAGWRLIFLINLPAGIVSLLMIWSFLDETKKDRSQQFDYPGALILTAGLVSLIYSLTEGREKGWPLWSIALLVLAVCIFILFIRHQRHKTLQHKGPLIDISLFRIREFNLGLLTVLFHFMLHTAYLLMCAVYLQNGLGLTAFACGMYFIPHAILFMISAMAASHLIVRFGKKVLLLGAALIMVSFILQVFLFRQQPGGFCVMLLIGLYGLGNGLVLPSLLTVALGNLPEKHAGVAAGIFSTFQQTASALGISIMGGIYYYILNQTPLPDHPMAFAYGIGANILCLCVVIFILFLLPQPGKQGALSAHAA